MKSELQQDSAGEMKSVAEAVYLRVRAFSGAESGDLMVTG